MQCQIVHDSLHSREGWTQSYLLKIDNTVVGYGSIAIGGPWKGTRTVFEFYVESVHRSRISNLFATFVAEAGVTAFEVQTNDVWLNAMLHNWCRSATSQKVVFHDKQTTTLLGQGTIIRRFIPKDAEKIFPHHDEPVGDRVLEVNGEIVATGGVLFHYNPPYGDLYVEVAAPFRRRGLGSYLIQELKRSCYDGGHIPCARCSLTNVASIKTIQKAGFGACALIMAGPLSPRSTDVTS